jgi:hypothetical protein
MERKPQNLQNHAKLDPTFHFFLAPLALAFVIYSIVNVVRNPGMETYMHLVVAIWAMVFVFKMRLYSLKVQDRVIRLEERIRMASLLSDPLKAKSATLTERQIIAIRFASDAELPALVDKALAGDSKPKDIKAAIQTWRPDYWRV